MRARLLRPIWILALAATVSASSSGAARADELFGRDKALHFGASAAIALAGYGGGALVFPERPPRLVLGGGLALLAGIGKEVSDHFRGGDPSWRDLGWDVLGTATGLAVARGIDWLWSRAWR